MGNLNQSKSHGFPLGRPRRTCVAVASCAFRRFASCNCCCCNAEDRNSASWSSRHGQRALQKAGKAMGKCGKKSWKIQGNHRKMVENMGTCGKTMRKSRENKGKLGKHEKIWGKHGNMWENHEKSRENTWEKHEKIREKHGNMWENSENIQGKDGKIMENV